jgi:hypothetical protein
MVASAARADVAVQCWESEFNSADLFYFDTLQRAVLKEHSYLRYPSLQREFLLVHWPPLRFDS